MKKFILKQGVGTHYEGNTPVKPGVPFESANDLTRFPEKFQLVSEVKETAPVASPQPPAPPANPESGDDAENADLNADLQEIKDNPHHEDETAEFGYSVEETGLRIIRKGSWYSIVEADDIDTVHAKVRKDDVKDAMEELIEEE